MVPGVYIFRNLNMELMKSDKDNIIAAVREAGVVGAGGAGFPTHVKLQAQVETLIANGAECEPLLANDKAMIMNAADDLLEGLRLTARAVGAERQVIAVKAKHQDVIRHLESSAGNNIAEIFRLSNYYPSGDEQEIVREVTGKTVPEAGLPLDVGAVVQNVETLINIAHAVEGKPVTRRVLTVIGEVAQPAGVDVPIGISVKEVIEFCGGLTCADPVLYIGGPMMGEVQKSLDVPVTKTSTGLFILPADNFLIQKRSIPVRHIIRQAQSACTDCMQCTEACPRYLLGHKLRPHKIMNAVTLGLSYQSDVFLEAYLCMFCGVCEYACPMWLSPRRIYIEVRTELQKRGLTFPRSEKTYGDHPMRRYRRVTPERLIRRYELSRYDVKLPREIRSLSTGRVTILTKQHLGKPAQVVVEEGDYVQEEQLIGEIPEGQLGARIHASIEGRVIHVDTDKVIIEG
jgi:RnfABCDGE-type electron transport complex C subunit